VIGSGVPRVLAVAGSPSSTSRSAALVERAAALLQWDEGNGGEPTVQVDLLRVRDIPPAALVSADLGDPALAASHRALEEADGVIVGTPVYKASYSGLLKVWLDSLDQFALRGKSVFPLAVGGGTAHVLVLDYALRPVLQSFDPRVVTAGYFVQESKITRSQGGAVVLPEDVDGDLARLVETFRHTLYG